MSQWGAYGYARNRWKHAKILAHYYPGTVPARRTAPPLRVLIADGSPQVQFKSSVSVAVHGPGGEATLAANQVGTVKPSGASLVLARAGLADVTLGAEASATPSPGGLLTLVGPDANGRSGRTWRGSFVALLRSGKVRLIDRVGVEDYLRGVVPFEVSASWPAEALQSQAVAARSYALASATPGGDFDLYATTRSQYYGGRLGETSATDKAVSETARQVLTFSGGTATPVVAKTFFFASSGGRTESVQNVWGGAKVVYLSSVDDPYDTYSPQHVWAKPLVLDEPRLGRLLGSYNATANPVGVKGSLRGVRITLRGLSPRVRRLEITGSRGINTVSGERLRAKLGLKSTWFSVTRVALGASPATLTAGSWLRLTGSVLPRPAGGRAFINYRTDGSAWRSLSVVCDKAGRVDVRVRPARRTVYELGAGVALSARRVVPVVPRITLSGPGAIDFGASAVIRVRLSPARPGTYVRILVQRAGETAFRQVARLKLSSRGATATVTPDRNALIRAVWDGDRVYQASSAESRVGVRVLVTLSASTASPRVGKTVTLRGVIVPSSAAPVGREVRIELFDGTAWSTVLTPKTQAQAAYAATWKPSRAGTFRLRARYLYTGTRYLGNVSPELVLTAS
jgi:stage II sporulation protein D